MDTELLVCIGDVLFDGTDRNTEKTGDFFGAKACLRKEPDDLTLARA